MVNVACSLVTDNICCISRWLFDKHRTNDRIMADSTSLLLSMLFFPPGVSVLGPLITHIRHVIRIYTVLHEAV